MNKQIFWLLKGVRRNFAQEIMIKNMKKMKKIEKYVCTRPHEFELNKRLIDKVYRMFWKCKVCGKEVDNWKC